MITTILIVTRPELIHPARAVEAAGQCGKVVWCVKCGYYHEPPPCRMMMEDIPFMGEHITSDDETVDDYGLQPAW